MQERSWGHNLGDAQFIEDGIKDYKKRQVKK